MVLFLAQTLHTKAQPSLLQQRETQPLCPAGLPDPGGDSSRICPTGNGARAEGASPRGDEGPEQCGIKPSPGQRLLGRCLRPYGTIPLSFLPGIPAAPSFPHLQSVPPPHTPRKFSLQELLQTGRLLPSPRRGKENPRFHTHKHFPPQLRAGTAGGRAGPCNKEVKRDYPGGAPRGRSSLWNEGFVLGRLNTHLHPEESLDKC